MSENGNKMIKRLKLFSEILANYETESVFGHYLDVVVELRKDQVVSEDHKRALNSIDAANDLAPNMWRLFH